MENKIRRVGILTSGGDAPGMNAAVRSAVRTCLKNGVIPVGIRRGYQGLIHADVLEMTARTVNGITHRGGTVLYTARSEDFMTEKELLSMSIRGFAARYHWKSRKVLPKGMKTRGTHDPDRTGFEI